MKKYINALSIKTEMVMTTFKKLLFIALCILLFSQVAVAATVDEDVGGTQAIVGCATFGGYHNCHVCCGAGGFVVCTPLLFGGLLGQCAK